MTNPRTLTAYENGVDEYVAALATTPSTTFDLFRNAYLADLPDRAQLLELGSGPGLDASWFEAHGLTVRRTDATEAFVRRLRELGHDADVLNVLTDDLGGPYDGIWASAVLLHLTRLELADLLPRLRAALRPGGVFGFSVKEGDGEAWVTNKLAQPRFFVYWRAEPLTALLAASGWRNITLTAGTGRTDDWLQVRCTA